MWDLFKQEACNKDIVKKDSIKIDSFKIYFIQQSIFEHHKISAQQFNESYTYYTQHPDLLGAVLDSMIVSQNKVSEEFRFRARKKINVKS